LRLRDHQGELKDRHRFRLRSGRKHAAVNIDEELETKPAIRKVPVAECTPPVASARGAGDVAPELLAQTAVSDDKMRDCFDTGACVLNMIEGHQPATL
jgi:hypothetical protein